MPRQKIIVKNVPDGIDGAPPWITTFVDMVSLLVTFFILLYTFSSIREFDTFTYPRTSCRPAASSTAARPTRWKPLRRPHAGHGSRARLTQAAHASGERAAREHGGDGSGPQREHVPIDLRAAGDGLRVRFSDNAGFQPGSAEVRPALEKALTELGDTASYYPLMVVVEGHTDDAFMPSPSFPDAYAMSIARRAPRRTSSSSAVNSTRPWCSSRDTAPTGRASTRRALSNGAPTAGSRCGSCPSAGIASRPCSQAKSPGGGR